MEFVRCKESDFKAVTDMYKRVVEYLTQTVNYPKWSESHPSDDAVGQAIQNGELYACVENSRIIGATSLSENPEGAYEAGDWSRELGLGEFLVIHMLAVDPDYSGRGAGGFMVERCLDLAEKQNYKAVRLDVVPDNIPALRLYKSKGFKYAGTKDLLRGIEEVPEFDLYEFNFEGLGVSNA